MAGSQGSQWVKSGLSVSVLSAGPSNGPLSQFCSTLAVHTGMLGQQERAVAYLCAAWLCSPAHHTTRQMDAAILKTAESLRPELSPELGCESLSGLLRNIDTCPADPMLGS